MTQDLWTSIDTYFNDRLVPSDSMLEAALADSKAADLPTINVSPNQGKLLNILAQIQRPQTILEIGTLGGYSTIWLARALPADGHLITLEVNPKHAEVARANIERAGLASRVEVRVGRAVDSLAKLMAEGHGAFDLVFIDADKPSNPEYLAWALKLSHRGTLIIIDNIVSNAKVLDAASDDPTAKGIRRLVDMMAAEPRLSAVTIQTVGTKGHDGFALAVVIKD